MRYSYIIPIIVFFLTITSCTKKNKDEIQPTKGTITESVYASGVVKSENQYTVYPTVNGVLQKNKCRSGSIDYARSILIPNRKR